MRPEECLAQPFPSLVGRSGGIVGGFNWSRSASAPVVSADRFQRRRPMPFVAFGCRFVRAAGAALSGTHSAVLVADHTGRFFVAVVSTALDLLRGGAPSGRTCHFCRRRRSFFTHCSAHGCGWFATPRSGRRICCAHGTA